jgi:hypothetical protein
MPLDSLVPDLEEDTRKELIREEPRAARRVTSAIPRRKGFDLSPNAVRRLDEMANAAAPRQAAIAKPPTPEKPLGLMGTIREGAKGTLRALGATADTMQGDAEGVVKAAQDQANAPKDPDLERFYAHIDEQKKALGENPSLWEGIKAVGGAAINNPRGFGLMVAEQLPNSAAALGAGAVGALAGSFAGPAGTVIGGLAGLASANIGLETGSKALEAAQDGAYTPEEQSRVRREGLTKGGVITGVDALTLGATKFITGTTRRAVERATTKTLVDNGVDVTNAAARKAALQTPEIADKIRAAQELAQKGATTLGKRLARTGGAAALETIGEGAGEYLGELAATGKANAVDAVVEGFAGLGTSIGEIAATGAMNRKGLKRLFDNPETAEETAKEEAKQTGVPHEVIKSPTEPDKYVAVPKVRSVGGIELTRDADGNLKPVQPVSTQADFNLANKPGFELTAEDKLRQQQQTRAREDAYAKNPLIVPGTKTKPATLGGKPIDQVSNNVLIYTVNRGSARAKEVATAEIDRRKTEGVSPEIANAPEKPADTIKRIVATGAEKAKEDAKKASSILTPSQTPKAQPTPLESNRNPIPEAQTQVVLPDNTSLPAQWDVVDADSINATIKEGKNQPRDRSRAASDIQIQGIANNPDYRRLADSPVMDVGAPTISHDGAIVGGNGRFEGVSRAYDQGSANDYLAQLKADAAAKGIDPARIDTMKKPVLVRRITQPFDTRKLAIASNSGTGLQYSGLELAKIDAERMKGLENLEISDSGDVALTGSNIQNIRQALGGYSAAELGSLVDKDGRLSQEGVRRIRNAMLYSAYGSNPTLERLVESTDNDLRNISGALVKATGSAAKAREDIKAGRLPAELDISEDLVGAVETLSKIKAQGQTAEDFLSQIGMFGDEINDQGKFLLRMLEANMRSQRKIADFIRTYYDSVSRIDTSTNDIFGAGIPTKPELLKNAKERITEKQPESADLFAKPANRPETPVKSTTQGPKESTNNARPDGGSKKDQQVKKEEGTGGAAPKVTPKPESGLRPLIESLIKRRAAAKQSGKERSINTVINRAKEVMAGTRTDAALESKWFRNQATAMRRADPDTADILSKISEEIKTAPEKKETPKFSRSKPTKEGKSYAEAKQVHDIVNEITQRWKNAPQVIVMRTMADAPAEVRAENERQLSLGATGEPEAFVHNNEVYIVADQMKSPGDVLRVMLHESLGHFGLRGVFGTELDSVLKHVAALRKSEIEAKSKQYGLDASKESDRLIAAEEVLAEMAQRNPKSSLIQRAITQIRYWLRNHIPGFKNMQFSDSEIIENFLVPAREFVQGKTTTSQTTTPAFKKWFGNSKVVDAQGKPLVVYHGTGRSFSKFDPDRATFEGDYYFAGSAAHADHYARSSEGDYVQGSNIMPVFLAMKNPLIVDYRGARDMDGLMDTKEQAKAGGRDGVIAKNTNDGYGLVDQYIVFSPDQIKSATGNTGAFDSANPDIRFSRSASPTGVSSAGTATPSQTATPAAPPIRERMERVIDTLIYNFQDRFKPLKDIQKRVGIVPEEEDAALAEERYSGTVRARIDEFEASMRDPLIAAIHESGVEYDDVEEYLHALHAPSRNAAMREINPTESELKDKVDALTAKRDALANDVDVAEYLRLRRELRQAEADIEDGIADESLVRAINSDLARVRQLPNVKDYADAIDKLKALRLVKPFQGDNTALSGMSDAQAKAVLAKIDANGTRKALERVSSLVDAITSKTRQIYIDSGLEKANVIESWNKNYEHYVPLHRDEVSGNSMPRIGQGFNIRGKESKRATGSTKEVTNILAHVVAQHEAAIIRSEKAKVDRALFQFAQRNPDPSLWTLDNAPMMRTVDPTSGLVVERVDPTYKNRPEVLTLKIDGEEHTITFNDQNQEAMRLAASMKNMSSEQMGEVTQMVGKFTRWLAQVNTSLNPVFTARNFLRDLQTAYVNLTDTELADKKKEVFRDVRAAIKGMWDLSRGKKNSQWAKYAQEFKNAGGQTGWMEHYKDIGKRADALREELAAMKPGKLRMLQRTTTAWWHVVQDANNAVENGARLSAYVNARRSGLSEGKAAQLAKNLTVNFNTRGAKGAELNAWYMFMNASIQGSARLFKALGNKQVRKITAGIILSGFLMDILARSMAGDDDEDGENDYDQLPEHVKAMNFVFMVNNRPVTIPMPYGYNFFASAGRKISEIMFRPNYSAVKSAADLAGVFMDAFSPTGQAGSGLQYISPTVTDPFVQWAENKNFAGNPLRKPQQPFGVPNPEYLQGFKSNSAAGKWLAEMLNDATGGNEVRPGFINVNPAFFDFAVSSIAGGAGRTYLQTLSAPMKLAQGEELQAREIPFLNIFASAKPEYQTEKKYFEATRAVETAAKELKTYKEKGDTEMVRQIREDHGKEIRLAAAAKETKNLLTRLRKNELNLDKTNPPNKRELKKAIEEKRKAAMAKFNKKYREAVSAK